MDSGTVNIVLKSSSQGSGLTKVLKDTNGLAQAIGRLGTAFGTTGHLAANFLANLVKGGIWGIAQAAVSGLIGLWGKWREAQEEAAKKVAETERELHEERMSRLDEYAEKAAKASAARTDAINKESKAIMDELDATKELIKATLELQRVTARRSGDKDAVRRIDERIEGLDRDFAAQKLEKQIAIAEKREASARREVQDLQKGRVFARSDVRAIDAQIKARIKEVREEAAKSATGAGNVVFSIGPDGRTQYSRAGNSEDKEAQEAAAEEAEIAFLESDEYKTLQSRLKDAKKRSRGIAESIAAAKRNVKAAEKEVENLGIRADTLITEDEIARLNKKSDDKDTLKTMEDYQRWKASGSHLPMEQWLEKEKEDEKEAIKKQKEQYRDFLREKLGKTLDIGDISQEDAGFKKFVEDRKAAAEKAKNDELAAQKQIAEQRLKDERELHQQRMDDLKKEIDKANKNTHSMTAIRSAAQSEFDRAFAMYRDPSRARAEIGEEQAYRDDLDRLHKDARRYGGKWRIDELSALMSRGDTQGVSDTLAQWRKSSRFTPDVEAMVRASAAEKTKTTAEDELRKLNDKTSELARQLEQLSQERDVKLDSINRNTSQLANKLDELLTVKG